MNQLNLIFYIKRNIKLVSQVTCFCTFIENKNLIYKMKIDFGHQYITA